MSKRMVAVALAAGLVAGAMSMPAEAAKKKKAAKPIPTVLFLDGDSAIGEVDRRVNGTYLKLSKTAGDASKSYGIPNYVGGPNTQCAGGAMVPTFVGDIAGTIKGNMKVTFEAVASPSTKVEVRVWPDLAAQVCDDEYVEPAGSTIVDLPTSQGKVEAVIEGLDFSPKSVMMIQLTSVLGAPPTYGRAFYGTKDTKVEFQCVPAAGSKSCV